LFHLMFGVERRRCDVRFCVEEGSGFGEQDGVGVRAVLFEFLDVSIGLKLL
jgi:hypothetical protein